MKNAAIKLLSRLLDMLYPPKCLFCGELIAPGDSRAVCGECGGTLDIFRPGACLICGSGTGAHPGFCGDCARSFGNIDGHISFCAYDAAAKEITHKFKYGSRPEYAAKIAEYMALHMDFGFLKDFDAILAVPLHWRKERKRGFNQAELLASELCKMSGKPLLKKALRRGKNTLRQSAIPFGERRGNVEGAFAVKNREAVRGKRLLLADDIFTSGSTVGECAKVLKEAGAISVTSFAFALAGSFHR